MLEVPDDGFLEKGMLFPLRSRHDGLHHRGVIDRLDRRVQQKI